MSGSVSSARGRRSRTVTKKYRSKRNGRRSFYMAVEYATMATIANEGTRTATTADRAVIGPILESGPAPQEEGIKYPTMRILWP
jgi:hypothetical protein